MRSEPLPRQVRAQHRDPAPREKRAVRHRPVRRAASLRRLGAGTRLRLPARRQATLHQTPALRQGTSALPSFRPFVITMTRYGDLNEF